MKIPTHSRWLMMLDDHRPHAFIMTHHEIVSESHVKHCVAPLSLVVWMMMTRVCSGQQATKVQNKLSSQELLPAVRQSLACAAPTQAEPST